MERSILAFHGETAAGVEVVILDGLFHLLQSHVIFQQGVRIDQHLVLLAVAADYQNLSNSWHLEEPWPDHPIRRRSQVQPLLQRRPQHDFMRLALNDNLRSSFLWLAFGW